MATPEKDARFLSLPIVILGMIGMTVSWVLTPKYGPWVSNAVTAIPTLAAAFLWGETARNLRLTSRTLALSLVTGVTLVGLSALVAPIMMHLIPSLGAELKGLYATLNTPPGPLRASPILLVTAATEEVVWRGELVTWLKRRWGIGPTVLIATLCYSLPTAASQSILLFALANGLGVVLTLLRLMSGSWVAPWVAHAIWALGVFVVHPIAS